MLCPNCLADIDLPPGSSEDAPSHLFACPACRERIPTRYVRNYGSHPPVVFSLMGLPSHGKTSYLSSLLTQLDKIGLSKGWRGFSWSPLDEAGANLLLAKKQILERAKLPDPTQGLFPTPVALEVNELPAVGDCHVLIYDTAGEVFEDVRHMKVAGSFVSKSETVIWLLSLFEPEAPDSPVDPDRLMRFLTIYLQGVQEMGRDPGRQRLLVALAKCDVLLTKIAGQAPERKKGGPLPTSRAIPTSWSEMNSPGVGRDLFQFSPLPGQVVSAILGKERLRSLRNPLGIWERKLEALSGEIGDWLEGQELYSNLVRQLRRHFLEVRYCTVSAYGSRPAVEDRVAVTPTPRGVVAPLVWAAKLQRERVDRERTSAARRTKLGGLGLYVRHAAVAFPVALGGAALGGTCWGIVSVLDTVARREKSYFPGSVGEAVWIGALWGALALLVAGLAEVRRVRDGISMIGSATSGAVLGVLLGLPINVIGWGAGWLVTNAGQLTNPLSDGAFRELAVNVAVRGAYAGAVLGCLWGIAAWGFKDRKFRIGLGGLSALAAGSVVGGMFNWIHGSASLMEWLGITGAASIATLAFWLMRRAFLRPRSSGKTENAH